MELPAFNEQALREAMWTRYLPQFRVLSEILQDHELGDVHLATANVGWRIPPDDTENKLFSPELAGGVGLDQGHHATRSP